MKRFSLFNRFKKDKDQCPVDIGNSVDVIPESYETFGLKEDFDFFIQSYNKNHETAEDAISIRSVDCKNKIKWNKRIVNFGNKPCNSKSVKNINQSISHHNLNIISEKGETPSKFSIPYNTFSKSSNLFAQNEKFGSEIFLRKAGHILPEDFSSTLLEEIISQSSTTLKNTSFRKSMSPLYGITTAAIVSRHDSTSSTHSMCKQAWIETEIGRRARNLLTKEEIERQNIIHELLMGEVDALNDLKGVIKHYKEPLEKLQLLSPGDSFNIFYIIDKIIPVYETLINLLEEEKNQFGVIICIGSSLSKWSDLLDPVIKYCSHLYFAKSILEEKRKDKDIAAFLQCCAASKFSRKLDLWNFLDNPRSKLMKYPLLIERILKSTDSQHPDYSNLSAVLNKFEVILVTLDKKTGEEMCNFYLGKLDFFEPNQYINLVKNQNLLLLEGNLKIGRSVHFQKVHAFLFAEILVFTKPTGEERNDSTRYVVYNSPLPTSKLVLENINDGEIKIGSFRSTFSSDKGSRNVFRLTLLSNFFPENEFEDQKYGDEKDSDEVSSSNDKYENSSHDCRLLKNSQTILQVSNLEEKQLWLNTLRKVVAREIRREEM